MCLISDSRSQPAFSALGLYQDVPQLVAEFIEQFDSWIGPLSILSDNLPSDSLRGSSSLFFYPIGVGD